MIHNVPDPVEIEVPPSADLFFAGCQYHELPGERRVDFTMRSNELSILFSFDKAGNLASRPYTHFGHSEEVWDLLVHRNGASVTWKYHVTDLDEGVESGPEIIAHMEHWLGNSLNIEIDLSDLRKSVM